MILLAISFTQVAVMITIIFAAYSGMVIAKGYTKTGTSPKTGKETIQSREVVEKNAGAILKTKKIAVSQSLQNNPLIAKAMELKQGTDQVNEKPQFKETIHPEPAVKNNTGKTKEDKTPQTQQNSKEEAIKKAFEELKKLKS